MDTMPDNILLHIFYALNRESLCLGVRMTCTRWRQLTLDPSLWRYVTVPEHYTDARLALLLSQIHDHIEELDLSNCMCLTAESIATFTKSATFPRLKKLSVPISTTLPNEAYVHLAKACPVLEETENIHSTYSGECNPLACERWFKELKVVHDRPVSTYGRLRKTPGETDAEKRQRWVDDLMKTAEACPSISSYRCSRGMEFINGEGLKTISSTFPFLSSLELRNCTIDDDSVEQFFVNNKRYGGLVDINFDKPGPLTDRGLSAIADNCLTLKTIKISRCSQITNSGLQHLVHRCRDITDLHINNACGYFEDVNEFGIRDDVTDETLAQIGENLARLSFLRLFYTLKVTRFGLQAVVDGCPQLYGLMFFECGSIDDSALTVLQQCRFLKVMILVGADAVSPKGIINFVLASPMLARLTFYTKNIEFYGDMSPLGDEIYTQIDENPDGYRPNTVHKLALRGIGSGFLQLITVLCPNLLTLDVRDTCLVSNHSLVSVLQNCELLQNFDITSMGKADDDFLRGCCRYGNNLRVLSLGGAVHEMSTDALCDVIRHCVSLRMLTMDIMGSDVSEECLITTTKKSRGGRYFLYVDLDQTTAEESPKHRYIELHFTPIKYLGSISTIPYMESEP